MSKAKAKRGRMTATGQRLPRRPRWATAGVSTLGVALEMASRLTADEVTSAMAPIRAAYTVLQRGQGRGHHMAILRTVCYLGTALERHGNLAGGRELLAELASTLDAIEARSPGETMATLRATDMEAISLALDLHELQLQHCTFGEYTTARRAGIATCQQQGYRVMENDAGDAMLAAVLAEGSTP